MYPNKTATPHVAVEKDPGEAVRKQPRRVKAYCLRCQTRRMSRGYKAHNCEACQYKEPQTGARRHYNKRPPGQTSLAKSPKVYCEGCSARKKQGPAVNNRSRMNARHNCTQCLELRREAAVWMASEPQDQGPRIVPDDPRVESDSPFRPGADPNRTLSEEPRFD